MNKPAEFKYTLYDETYTIRLIISVYGYNNRTAILAETTEGEPFATFTVNLDDGRILDNDLVYLDTNNVPGVEEFFIENGLAVKTDRVQRSGYCTYPMVRLNFGKLKEVAKDLRFEGLW